MELTPDECPRCLVMLPSDSDAGNEMEMDDGETSSTLSNGQPLKAAVITKDGRLRYLDVINSCIDRQRQLFCFV